LWGTIALVAVLIPIAWFGWSVFEQSRTGLRYSPTTFCAVNAAAPEANVVLADATDKLSPRHQLALRSAIMPLASESDPVIAARGLVSIQAIDGHAGSRGLLRPIVTACRPPVSSSESPTGASEKRLKPAFLKYAAIVSKAVDEVSAIVPDSDASPLLEAVKAVSQDSAFSKVTGPRTITLVSDLLINIPGIMAERDNATLNYSRFASTPYGKEMSADLHGVKVKLVYLQRKRAHHLQTEAHLLFWRDWLSAQGAEVTEVSRVAE
jgi:hypothetical protein